jgi:RNA methyltransferase, TrmH family
MKTMYHLHSICSFAHFISTRLRPTGIHGVRPMHHDDLNSTTNSYTSKPFRSAASASEKGRYSSNSGSSFNDRPSYSSKSASSFSDRPSYSSKSASSFSDRPSYSSKSGPTPSDRPSYSSKSGPSSSDRLSYSSKSGPSSSDRPSYSSKSGPSSSDRPSYSSKSGPSSSDRPSYSSKSGPSSNDRPSYSSKSGPSSNDRPSYSSKSSSSSNDRPSYSSTSSRTPAQASGSSAPSATTHVSTARDTISTTAIPYTRPVRAMSEVARGKGNLDEIKLCGYNACQKLHDTRAEDIIRVYLIETRLEEFSELVKSCVRRRKAYHVVTSEDMDKISGSTHHEGVCIIAKRRLPPSWVTFLAHLDENDSKPTLVLILEDVANPHNVGAILRSAANFGCRYVLLPNEKDFKPSAALLRTAEGGGESVEFISAPSINLISTELRQRGMSVFGTALKGRLNLYQTGSAGTLPPRLAVMLGNEARGLSPDARKSAEGMITIPGTGAVQSLNVGIAAALVAGEYFRQHATTAMPSH